MDLSFKTDEGRFNYRVAGLIINEGKILIMKDERSPYYYVPGGRVGLHEKVRMPFIEKLEKSSRLK